MRGLLGWFLVLACCGLFGYWRTHVERSARAATAQPEGAGDTIEERQGTWHKLTIGRPSGAQPLEIEQLEAAAQELAPLTLREPGSSDIESEEPQVELAVPPETRAADFEYTVPAGRVLSKICEEFYGTGRAPVPARVAEYNKLPGPDSLQAGHKLLLPPWEVLFPKGQERP